MTEFLSAKNLQTGSECFWPEFDPTRSALAFEDLTTQLWDKRPDGWRFSFLEESAAPGIDPVSARNLINDAVAEIDEKLVVANSGRSLVMTSMRGETAEIPPEVLSVPTSFGIQVHNWDQSPAYRRVNVGSENQTLELLDRDSDYVRELSIVMRFRTPEDMVQLGYGLHRQQKYQHRTSDLTLAASLGRFVETGYEDGEHIVEGVEMSDDQELGLIRAIAQIGGFTLKNAG